jgi:hypothetical protein
MITQEPGALANRVVICDEHAAITTGIEILQRMETEATDSPDGPDGLAIESCARGLRGVFDHRKATRLGHGKQFFHSRRLASEMNGNDCARPRRDGPFYGLGIKI